MLVTIYLFSIYSAVGTVLEAVRASSLTSVERHNHNLTDVETHLQKRRGGRRPQGAQVVRRRSAIRTWFWLPPNTCSVWHSLLFLSGVQPAQLLKRCWASGHPEHHRTPSPASAPHQAMSPNNNDQLSVPCLTAGLRKGPEVDAHILLRVQAVSVLPWPA